MKRKIIALRDTREIVLFEKKSKIYIRRKTIKKNPEMKKKP